MTSGWGPVHPRYFTSHYYRGFDQDGDLPMCLRGRPLNGGKLKAELPTLPCKTCLGLKMAKSIAT